MTPLSKLTYSFFACSIMLNIDSLTISFNGLVFLSFGSKIFFPLNDVYKEYVGEYYSPFKVKKLLEEIDLLIDDGVIKNNPSKIFMFEADEVKQIR